MKAADIDKLLNEVGALADRAEKLVTQATLQNPTTDNNSSSTSKNENIQNPTSNEGELLRQEDIDHLDDMMNKQADELTGSVEATDSKAAEEESSRVDEIVTEEATAEKEITVDVETQKLAEDEINQAFSEIHNSSEENELPQSPNQTMVENPPVIAENYPAPVKAILVFLFTINRPFLWVPTIVRQILGYVGIGTLFFALGLWILLVILKRHS
jgi:hypothetical protein